MKFISLPIPDFGVLNAFDDASETISKVVNELEEEAQSSFIVVAVLAGLQLSPQPHSLK